MHIYILYYNVVGYRRTGIFRGQQIFAIFAVAVEREIKIMKFNLDVKFLTHGTRPAHLS